MSQAFELTISASTGREHVAYLRWHLLSAFRLVRTKLREYSVVLVGDVKMSALHVQFMNVAGPTDVLTFPIDDDADGRPVSGEVYLCVPEATRQVRQTGGKLRDELLLYALHGMLHLSGFDDKTPAEYRRMHRKEDDILNRLGIGRVFAPRAKEVRWVGSLNGSTSGKSGSRRKSPAPNHRPRGDRLR